MASVCPTIPAHEFPKNERGFIFFMNSQLSDLDRRCGELGAAVALFDMGEKKLRRKNCSSKGSEVGTHWVYMATRECAAAIYKFDEDVYMLNTNLNKCPTLLSKIDVVAKWAATKKLNQLFPDLKAIRDNGQHGGVLFGSPDKLREHTDGKLFQVDNIVGRTWYSTHKKKRVSLEVSNKTHAALVDVRDMFWALFRHLDPFRDLPPF